MVSLRKNIVAQARFIDDPVARVNHVLALGGRIPPALGLAASPRAERFAWRAVAAASSDIRRPKRPRGSALLWLDEYGRVRYSDCASLPPALAVARDAQDRSSVIAEIEFDRETAGSVQPALERADQLDREDDELLREWEASLTGDGIYTTLVTLSDLAQHAAPLILFVREARFSNFTEENLSGKALLPGAKQNVFRPRGLDEMSEEPAEVRMAIYGASLLVEAGGAHRLEERNWTQVTPTHIAGHLEASRAQYAVHRGDQREVGPWRTRTSLFEAAALAREERDVLAGKMQRYRRIYAPVLNKQERFASVEAVECANATFEDSLAVASVRAQASPRYLPGGSAEYASVVAGRTIMEPPANEGSYRLTPFEDAIAVTVAATIRATGADVAMSRGHRQPRELTVSLAAGDWAALAQREQREFYCCVLPSPGRLVAGERPDLALALWAMAARMEFNSWHFFGGNLEEVADVRARDRFIPPRIPDTSLWSDQHHRGHISTNVRFGVRAPAPAVLAGRTFWGFNDVRLLRFAGEPFSELEMLVALAGARHVGRLTTALAADATRTPVARDHRMVTAFDRPWYLGGSVFDVVHELML